MFFDFTPDELRCVEEATQADIADAARYSRNSELGFSDWTDKIFTNASSHRNELQRFLADYPDKADSLAKVLRQFSSTTLAERLREYVKNLCARDIKQRDMTLYLSQDFALK